MGSKKYGHLSIEERCEIARRRDAGQSVRQIAAALDRSASSIARELKRNSGADAYRPSYAGEQAHARRWRGSKLLRNPELQLQRATRARQIDRERIKQIVAGMRPMTQAQRSLAHEQLQEWMPW